MNRALSNVCRKCAFATLLAISSAVAQISVTTIGSSASYQPVIAPDSLATVFGSNLANTIAIAQLDSNGQLPTTLGGTSMTVNGETVRLLYVSPKQINFLAPSDTTLGSGDVFIQSSTGSSVHATAQVTNTAPGLFSMDATGTGPGSILNGTTFTPPPFYVEDQSIQGNDKRTRLALFGTGIRYSGNSSRDPSVTNVAGNVTAFARDSSGNTYNLTVEYAGAAPVYPCLDQVNIVLPAQLDGAGAVSVSVSTDTGTSNTVTFQMASLPSSQIRLVGVSLAASYVTAGDSLTGTVSLNGTARTGGVTVSLRSNNVAVQLSNFVTIPQGSVTAQFTVQTSSFVTSTLNTTITAQALSGTQSVALEVDPSNTVQITSFNLGVSSIQGGNKLTATALLSGQAPGSGATIQLTSDNVAAQPPATLTVPFGSSSATVTIPTSIVTTAQTANITATLGHSSQVASVTLSPPFVLSLSNTSVTGGSSVTGTITLGQPAPNVGLTVNLKSSDQSALISNTFLSIPAGQNTASFTISTISVTATKNVTISATSAAYSGLTETASLAVNPPAVATLSSLSISPPTVSGGTAATGTVTLTAAPAAGMVVTLRSSSGYVFVPLTVTVPPGLSSATFAISTFPVLSKTTATITASVPGVSKTAALTLQ